MDPEGTEAAGSVGDRVRAIRTRLGISRETLAHSSGLSWGAVQQIESGRRKNPRPETLVALAGVLDVTVDYLVGSWVKKILLAHEMLVYASDAQFVEAAAPFLADGIEANEAVMAITSKRNIKLLKGSLTTTEGVRFVDSSEWHDHPLEALEGYHRFVEDGLRSGSHWARILAEPAWKGASEDERRRWTRYESQLNLALGGDPAHVLCPYDERTVPSDVLETAHRTHPAIRTGVEAFDNPGFVDPHSFALGGGEPPA
jgi:transcriptional regulator with XRE-family HTH domain